jgi:multiple sugar transport system substrate-binding protein
VSQSFSRRALLTATGSMGLLALAGCSAPATSAIKPSSGKLSGTVRALFMKQAAYSADNIASMTKSFEKANPGVKVTTDLVSYDSLHDKIVTAAAARVYDVVLIDVIWPAEFATKNIIRDITSDLPKSEIGQIFPGALQSAEYKGHYYGVPWILDTEYLFYNKDMLKKAGVSTVPASWDDVAAAGRAIKKSGAAKYPFMWAAAQAEELVCAYGALLGAYGGSWLDGSGRAAFNKGGGVQALEYMRMTFDEGLASPASLTAVGDDVRKAISQGDVAMGIDWTYVYALGNDPTQSAVAGKIGMAHTPSGPGGAPGINGSMALSVTSTSKNPAAALAYIQHLTSRPIQDEFAALSLPIWKSSYAGGATLKGVEPAELAVAKSQLGDMTLRPQVAQYNAISHALQVELQNALNGSKTPQKALDDAAAKADALIKA